MYNPRVFGKPESGKVCIWLSYWPIGNTLGVGDTVSVSIIVMCGLEVHECGVSLVYSDLETTDNTMGWEETPGGDLSGFQLSTGAYYLCRRDFFELMEVGRLTPDWFRILVGDNIEYTEVRGWRKTGRPKQVTDQSFTELKTVRCIIDGPELEDVYKIAKMSKSSIGDKTVAFTSSLLEGGMKFDARSEIIDNEMEDIFDTSYGSDRFISTYDEIAMEEYDPYSHEQKESEGMSKAVVSDDNRESSPPHGERLKSVVTHEVISQAKKKIVLSVNLRSQSTRHKMMNALSALQGIESLRFDEEYGKLIVTGDDLGAVFRCVSRIAGTEIISIETGPASERLAEEHETEVEPGYEPWKEDKPGYESGNEDEAYQGPLKTRKFACSVM